MPCKEVIEAESIKFSIIECGCISCSIKCHYGVTGIVGAERCCQM